MPCGRLHGNEAAIGREFHYRDLDSPLIPSQVQHQSQLAFPPSGVSCGTSPIDCTGHRQETCLAHHRTSRVEAWSRMQVRQIWLQCSSCDVPQLDCFYSRNPFNRVAHRPVFLSAMRRSEVRKYQCHFPPLLHRIARERRAPPRGIPPKATRTSTATHRQRIRPHHPDAPKITRRSIPLPRQRADNPRPGAGALMEAREVVFLVR